MQDSKKTKKQLIAELEALRQQNTELRAAESERRQRGEKLYVRERKRRQGAQEAQEKMTTTEQLFHDFMNNSPLVAYIKDAAGRHVYANTRFERLFDMDGAEWQGQTNFDLFPTETARQLDEHDAELLAAKQTVELRETTVQEDGEHHWLTHKFPLTDRTGQPLLGGLSLDITELKQVEEALQASEKHVRQQLAELDHLYRTAPVGLSFMDPELRFVRINEEMAAINGRPVSAHLGVRLGEVVPDIAQTESHCRRVLALGEPLLNQELHGATPAEPAKECDWLVSYYPVKSEAGTVVGITTVVQDVTESKRAEEALQKAHDQLEGRVQERTAELTAANTDLRAEVVARRQAEAALQRQALVLEHMAEGVQMTRTDGIIFLTNPAWDRMFGYAQGALIGQHVNVLNDPPEEAQRVTDAIMESLQTHGTWTGEVRNRKQDGSPFLTFAQVRTLEIEGQTYWVTVQQDITERKAAEENLRTALREKELLLQEVHHRVKNNLQLISSLLRLQSRSCENTQAQALLAESRDRVQSIALIHEKLYQSQDFADIDFQEYTDTLLRQIFIACNADPAKIALHLDIEQCSIGIDIAIPCGLILNELVTNAVKHAFPNGNDGTIHVEMGVDDPDQTVCLTVTDTGVGLAAQDHVASRQSLGLRIVKLLVEQMHGELEFHAHPGTQIAVRIPCAPKENGKGEERWMQATS